MTTRRKTPKLKLYPKLSIKECRLRQWKDWFKVPKYLHIGKVKFKVKELNFSLKEGYFFVLEDGEHFKPVVPLNQEIIIDGVSLKGKSR